MKIKSRPFSLAEMVSKIIVSKKAHNPIAQQIIQACNNSKPEVVQK
jgi:hypothetical protein